MNKQKRSFGLTAAGLLFAAVCSLPCAAQENALTSSKAIDEIEGVYKHSFSNGLVSGERYRSEDVIEIMKYSPDAIYFRIALQFFNGHSCGIYGIAKFNKGAFVYQNSEDTSTDQACTLRIRRDNKWLKITDADDAESFSTCRFYCGMRGSLKDYEISMAKKRQIKYRPLILKSRQYLEAVGEHKMLNDPK